MADVNGAPVDAADGTAPATKPPNTDSSSDVRTGLEGTDSPVIGGHRTGKAGWLPGQKPRDPFDLDLDKFVAIQSKIPGGKAEDVAKFLAVRDVLANARKEAEARVKAGKDTGTGADAGASGGPGTGTDDDKKKDGKKEGKTDAEIAAELLAKQALDNKFTDVSGTEIKAPTAPTGWGAQYINTDKWDTPVKDAENPHTLTADQWRIILKSNKTMHGFVVREAQNDVVKARTAAFELAIPSGSTATTAIPEFEVYDSSSISIKETRTSLQKSLAENGFTSNSVESAASGGAFGVSAGISAALRTQSSNADASNDQSDEKEYYATYNFPRVRMFMDEQNMTISPACQADLSTIESAADSIEQEKDENVKNILYDKADLQLQDFSKKYGHIFSTSFQLGGQLQGTKSASSLLMQKESDKRDALKTSVAVSFSSMYASGSAKYAYENQSHENTKEQSIQDLNTLAWTARGGNTLTCANPPQWAGTVSNHQSWRVIEQEEVIPLHTLIGRFSGSYSKVPKLFEDIAQRKVQQKKASTPQGSWSGKIQLRLPIQRKRLALNERDSGTIIATDAGFTDQPKEAVFTVLSANFDDTGTAKPVMSQLLADYPVFLVAGDSYSRDKNKGNQIQGLWVNSSGQIKPETAPGSWICRWSFRKPDYDIVSVMIRDTDGTREEKNYPKRPVADVEMNDGTKIWNPLSGKEIKDGDFVQLYCHSVNYGVFRDLKFPPHYGSRVLLNDDTNQFACLGYGDPSSWGMNKLYDEGSKDFTGDMLKELTKNETMVRISEICGGAGISALTMLGNNNIWNSNVNFAGRQPLVDLPEHTSWKESRGFTIKTIFQVKFVQDF